MNNKEENKKVKPKDVGSLINRNSAEVRDNAVPSCSFTSTNFDPVKALNTPNLCNDNITAYEDIYALRDKAHSEELLTMSHVGVEGVAGPGGFPTAKIGMPKITQGRHFTEDQGPLPGKPRRRLRNVLTRMEEVQGPFAALRKCRDTQTRIKVYTRNHSEVRGIMTGYVIAFDKHWNLLLRDVDEIFQKKIKCKTPVFGDVNNFTKVADLSIRDETDPEYKNPDTDPTPLVWQNPFLKKLNPGQPFTAVKDKNSHSEMPSSLSCNDHDWEKRREARSTHGRRVDREVLRGSSSFTREANTLRLGRATVWDEREENRVHEQKSLKNKSSKNEEEGRSDKSNDLVGEQHTVKHNKRKRSKIELRQRHVGQILVRGENVVLVNVLQV